MPIGAPTILEPETAGKLAPGLSSGTPRVWVYRYVHPFTRWRLSIATHAEPGSLKLSLGGFRIAPEARTASPGFDSDREAVGLAIGMEEKVHWSRLLGVGGPLALRNAGRIVGGKCVLHPTPEARVGQPRDVELLDFAIACFKDVEARAGFRLTTGQDLGHGVMSDGRTQSLQYLTARFAGSVVADTSRPTGEGNHHVLARRAMDAVAVNAAGARSIRGPCRSLGRTGGCASCAAPRTSSCPTTWRARRRCAPRRRRIAPPSSEG